MSDVALANEPEARTATGEIRDQTQPPLPTPPTETKPPETPTATEAKPETKPEDDKSSLLNKDRKKEEPSGAPDKYEAFKVPEGHEIAEDTAKEVGTLFKELNLSQAQGQKLVDYWVKNNQEAFEAPFKAWEDVQKKWTDAVKIDPEMGHRLPEIKTTIGKALDSLGDTKLASEFRDAMDYTGAGNNPAFIKAFWKLAQAVTEGGHVAGSGPSPHGQKAPGQGPPSPAKALYPNLP
jgi:hypothetical protein